MTFRTERTATYWRLYIGRVMIQVMLRKGAR